MVSNPVSRTILPWGIIVPIITWCFPAYIWGIHESPSHIGPAEILEKLVGAVTSFNTPPTVHHDHCIADGDLCGRDGRGEERTEYSDTALSADH